MMLRVRDKNGISHVTEVEYVEIEEAFVAESRDGKGIFKGYTDTYSAGHNENETVVVVE